MTETNMPTDPAAARPPAPPDELLAQLDRVTDAWDRESDQRLELQAELARLRAGLAGLMEKWTHSRAHTYASENADLYRGFDNGLASCAEQLAALLDPPGAPREETGK